MVTGHQLSFKNVGFVVSRMGCSTINMHKYGQFRKVEVRLHIYVALDLLDYNKFY